MTADSYVPLDVKITDNYTDIEYKLLKNNRGHYYAAK